MTSDQPQPPDAGDLQPPNVPPPHQRRADAEDGPAVRQMELVGVRVEMATNNPIVLLKETEGERYLPIWVGRNEATAIAFAGRGMVPSVPLTHDLMRDMLEVLGIRLTTVEIRELREGNFLGVPHVRQRPGGQSPPVGRDRAGAARGRVHLRDGGDPRRGRGRDPGRPRNSRA